MSQLLHYPRELSSHWPDLAHVHAGVPLYRSASRLPSEFLHAAYTDELPAPRRSLMPGYKPGRMAGAFGGMGRFAISFAAAAVSLALPGSSWLIDTLRS